MTTWLTETLLYTGLLIALVLLVRRPAARLFGPRLAYSLWALPALRLILPPIQLPASMAPEQAQLSDQALLALAIAARDAPAAAATPLWERADLWLALWLGGATLFLASRAAGYLRMRRELLAEARPVGEVGSIRLVETPAVKSPVAFGVRDKVVALPPLFMAMEDRAARDLAIAHELAHHRGRDILANFAAQPLLALHWFNPVAWLAWRAMRRDQEAACDARVLEGRGRDERIAYAGLIAGFAAGPRLSLAAPMACPIIGEKSIVHRLRSLTMSDIPPSRRRLGRALLLGGALALPLTASITYAAAAQDSGVESVELAPSDAPPAPPVPPAPPRAPDAPLPPAPPPPPDAPTAGKQVRVFTLKREGEAPADSGPGARRVFAFRTDGSLSDEQKKRFEEMRKEWEKKGAEWEKMGKEHERLALAMADLRGRMPEVSENCDEAGGNATRDWTDDSGKRHIVICQRVIREQARGAEGQALASLRGARASIAGNSGMSASVRQQVLADLDREIARLEGKKD